MNERGSNMLDKIRYLFEIPDRENALKCYDFFNKHNRRIGEEGYELKLKEQMKIYLQMEDAIFQKHADE